MSTFEHTTTRKTVTKSRRLDKPAPANVNEKPMRLDPASADILIEGITITNSNQMVLFDACIPIGTAWRFKQEVDRYNATA